MALFPFGLELNSTFGLLYQQLVNNPVNWGLAGVASLLIMTVYNSEDPDKNVAPPSHPKTILFKDYTPTELSYFNGEEGKPIYMGVKRRVFDVTSGRNFYGPGKLNLTQVPVKFNFTLGGPYENFAGRDASRGLALNSFDAEVLTELNLPLDKLDNLSSEEISSLDDWESHFASKYTIVGRLIDPST